MAALDELEPIAGSLNQAEVWVVRNDADAAGELAGQAAEKIAAAGWIPGSRLRAREPGHLAAMTRDAVNGYQTRRCRPRPGRLVVAELREGDLLTGRPGPPSLTLQKMNEYVR